MLWSFRYSISIVATSINIINCNSFSILRLAYYLYYWGMWFVHHMEEPRNTSGQKEEISWIHCWRLFLLPQGPITLHVNGSWDCWTIHRSYSDNNWTDDSLPWQISWIPQGSSTSRSQCFKLWSACNRSYGFLWR